MIKLNRMKKIIISSVFLVVGFCINAQVNPHAIGLRLGGNGTTNGAEISYQHGMGSANRLELDLGFSSSITHSRMYVAGIYHWNWNITDALNWYAGPGASVGFRTYENAENYVNIGIGGQVGIEYDFSGKAPILLSLDARPMWNLLGHSGGFGWGAALGVRYIF